MSGKNKFFNLETIKANIFVITIVRIEHNIFSIKTKLRITATNCFTSGRLVRYAKEEVIPV